MCLAVPGKVLEVTGDTPVSRKAKVSFGGAAREVSLAYLEGIKPGDYVIVHVGFALSKVDPAEAENTLSILADLEALDREGP
jgi:hydrogenase expression/formation protein HypC